MKRDYFSLKQLTLLACQFVRGLRAVGDSNIEPCTVGLPAVAGSIGMSGRRGFVSQGFSEAWLEAVTGPPKTHLVHRQPPSPPPARPAARIGSWPRLWIAAERTEVLSTAVQQALVFLAVGIIVGGGRLGGRGGGGDVHFPGGTHGNLWSCLWEILIWPHADPAWTF